MAIGLCMSVASTEDRRAPKAQPRIQCKHVKCAICVGQVAKDKDPRALIICQFRDSLPTSRDRLIKVPRVKVPLWFLVFLHVSTQVSTGSWCCCPDTFDTPEGAPHAYWSDQKTRAKGHAENVDHVILDVSEQNLKLDGGNHANVASVQLVRGHCCWRSDPTVTIELWARIVQRLLLGVRQTLHLDCIWLVSLCRVATSSCAHLYNVRRSSGIITRFP